MRCRRSYAVLLSLALLHGGCGSTSQTTEPVATPVVSSNLSETFDAAASPPIAVNDTTTHSSVVVDPTIETTGDVSPTNETSANDLFGETVADPALDQIDVDRPLTNEPGASSLAALTKSEICSLVPDDEAQKIWNFTTGITSKGWTQTAEATSCSHIFNEEPTAAGTPNVVWSIERSVKADWPTAAAEQNISIEDITIGGRPARLVITAATETSGKEVAIFVEIDQELTLATSLYGDDKVMDPGKLTTQTERIVGRIADLRPQPEPAREAAVASVFDLTGGQLCGLLRDESAAALLADTAPSGISSYLLLDGSSSCSIGSAKLGLDFASSEPLRVNEETLEPTKVGILDAEWDKPSREGNKAKLGEAVQYVSLTVKWREVWVEVQARVVNNTPEVEAIVRNEMTHVLAQLETLMT